MKAILISIRPQWVELILNGIKKDEIRKGTAIGKAINRLIEEQGVAPMLIYCTKNDKQVLFGHTRDIELVDYRGTACYGDFRILRKGDKLTTDDNQPRLNGKVVARFNATAEEITKHDYYPSEDLASATMWYEWQTKSMSEDELLEHSCLKSSELNSYLDHKNGTDIRINDLEIFDKPKEISEFYLAFSYKGEKPFINAQTNSLVHRVEINGKIEYESVSHLTRAPQSWCYIEV